MPNKKKATKKSKSKKPKFLEEIDASDLSDASDVSVNSDDDMFDDTVGNTTTRKKETFGDEEENSDESEEEVDDELEDNLSGDSDSEKEYDNECLYDHVGDDDEDVDVDTEESNYDEPQHRTSHPHEYVKPENRITKPILFKYERVRIIGDRVKQLSLGAKPLIKNVRHMNPKKIAELELKYEVLPIKISRELPNNKKELWKISELTQ